MGRFNRLFAHVEDRMSVVRATGIEDGEDKTFGGKIRVKVIDKSNMHHYLSQCSTHPPIH